MQPIMRNAAAGLLACLAIFFLLFLAPLGSNAQTASVSQTLNAVTMSLVPAHPAAGQSVTATLSDYSFNIDSSQITWSVNGVTQSEGVGQKSFTFTMGPTGSRTALAATVVSQGGITETASENLTAGGVDLIWQADTTVPPQYEGKALYSIGSRITIVAMPDITDGSGNLEDPGNFVYTWKVNGMTDATLSGTGHQAISLSVPEYLRGDLSVDVEVDSLTGTTLAENSIDIPGVSPQILFYEDDPSFGLLTNFSAPSYKLTGNEVTFRAIPLYVATPTSSNDLSYDWQLNGQSVATQSTAPNELTLRQQGGSGTSQVGVTVEDNAVVSQSAAGSISISYGGQ